MNNEVIEMKINEHDKKILELDKRMDENERKNAEFRIQVENLCKDIQSLTVTMRWFIGLLVGSMVGFFIWYVQNIGR
jgi:hypothetical protein